MVSIQPNMQAHDELATLFSRNLTFNPEAQTHARDANLTPPSTGSTAYSVSQHYHHSTHIPQPSGAPGFDENQRRSSAPIPGEDLSSETILRIHGIDPAILTPSQVQLFRIAERAQQRRLLELWSICPPGNGADIPALAWSSTTVEQEEQLARLRYERLQQQQTAQAPGGHWHQQSAFESEPYMASGYEELMRREQAAQYTPRGYTPATDPVYMGADYAREQQQLNMATGYGAFEQFRGMGSGDAMDM